MGLGRGPNFRRPKMIKRVFSNKAIARTSVNRVGEHKVRCVRRSIVSKPLRWVVLSVFALSVPTLAQQNGVVDSTKNPLQVAILHWYEANVTTQFPVGSGPVAVAFDGASIWVANINGSNVTKLRASDGADLGTFTVGTGPTALAFDGANIWVVNSDGNTVTKLRASDGTTLGTFAVGSSPTGAAFDGANIWVTNFHGNSVTKLRASDGSAL